MDFQLIKSGEIYYVETMISDHAKGKIFATFELGIKGFQVKK